MKSLYLPVTSELDAILKYIIICYCFNAGGSLNDFQAAYIHEKLHDLEEVMEVLAEQQRWSKL